MWYHCALLHTLAAGDDGVGSIHTSTHLIQVHIHGIHCRREVLRFPTSEKVPIAQKRLQNLEIGDNLGFLSVKIKCCLMNLI